MGSRRLCREDYRVGWVSALPIELAAALCVLDEEHQSLDQDLHNDTNAYSLGRIGDHNVVIVCLPAGQIGNNSAAAAVTQMKSAFPSICFGLMVGIGGGVPSGEADIRLGDVVVSQPCNGHGGVVQFDFGRTTRSGFRRTGFLNAPPTILLNATSKTLANDIVGRSNLSKHLSKFSNIPEFTREKAGPDMLFHASYEHAGGHTCGFCDKGMIDRKPREGREVVVHYGTIASGNQVMKDAITRDIVSSELGGVLCFEMEAAGLMNSFPCLVIRGICDYADSHKNKKWQPYAASTAAAYAKEVLSAIPGSAVAITPTADESMTRERTSVQGPVGYQSGTMRVTFGSNNTGVQVGVSNAPINARLGGGGL